MQNGNCETGKGAEKGNQNNQVGAPFLKGKAKAFEFSLEEKITKEINDTGI